MQRYLWTGGKKENVPAWFWHTKLSFATSGGTQNLLKDTGEFKECGEAKHTLQFIRSSLEGDRRSSSLLAHYPVRSPGPNYLGFLNVVLPKSHNSSQAFTKKNKIALIVSELEQPWQGQFMKDNIRKSRYSRLFRYSSKLFKSSASLSTARKVFLKLKRLST